MGIPATASGEARNTRANRGGADPIRGWAACRWYAAFLRDPLGCLRETHRRYGTVTAFGEPVAWRERERFAVVALGPECNRQVFGDPALFRTTGQGVTGPRESAHRRLRYGMTRMQGERHRRQRELVMPAFQRRAVDTYCGEMVSIVDRLLERWSPGAAIDLRGEMRRLTLQTSTDILFRRQDPNRAHFLGELISEYLERSFSLGVVLFHMDLPGTPTRRLRRLADRIESEVLALIEEKRAGEATPYDVMSLLVRAHQEGQPWIEADDLIGQGMILFAASYETVANALIWSLFLLEQHPEVLAPLLDEIDGTLRGGTPAPEHFDRMPLLDAAVRESLRVLPPVPYTIRTVYGPTRLGDFSLRKRDRIFLSHYVTHHLPELYDEPDRFLPERWATLRRSQYEYLPFSAGPRTCIGMSFATQSIKVALSMILGRFRLRVAPGTRVDPVVRVTLSPRAPLPVAVRKRDLDFEPAPVRGDIHELVELPWR